MWAAISENAEPNGRQVMSAAMVLGWLVFAAVAAVGAQARGRSGWSWFFLAVLLSPLVAIILLFLMPAPLRTVLIQADAELRRKCPDCAEMILKDARVCKHCGFRLPEEALPQAQAMPASGPEQGGLMGMVYGLFEDAPGVAALLVIGVVVALAWAVAR
jgi:uncharacterized membrane protein YhdT